MLPTENSKSERVGWACGKSDRQAKEQRGREHEASAQCDREGFQSCVWRKGLRECLRRVRSC